MNHVTFETAVRLRDAGFPQPELNNVLGHVFYDRLGRKYLAVWQDNEDSNILMQPYLHNYSDLKNPMVFAPTATDIMRALPGISLRWHSFHRVWQTRYKRNENRQAHENPAEACALVWLRLL